MHKPMYYVVSGPKQKHPTRQILVGNKVAALRRSRQIAQEFRDQGLVVKGNAEHGYSIDDSMYLEVIPFHEAKLYGIREYGQ